MENLSKKELQDKLKTTYGFDAPVSWNKVKLIAKTYELSLNNPDFGPDPLCPNYPNSCPDHYNCHMNPNGCYVEPKNKRRNILGITVMSVVFFTIVAIGIYYV